MNLSATTSSFGKQIVLMASQMGESWALTVQLSFHRDVIFLIRANNQEYVNYLHALEI